jgi:hypothetical protein
MAKQARKRTAAFDLGITGNLRRVQRGILHVRNRLLADVEIVDDEKAIEDMTHAALGTLGLIGSVAKSLERLADAKEREASAMAALAEHASSSEQH